MGVFIVAGLHTERVVAPIIPLKRIYHSWLSAWPVLYTYLRDDQGVVETRPTTSWSGINELARLLSWKPTALD